MYMCYVYVLCVCVCVCVYVCVCVCAMCMHVYNLFNYASFLYVAEYNAFFLFIVIHRVIMNILTSCMFV